MMHTGLHAVGLGLSRLAIVIGLTVLGAVLAYVALIFVIVVIQAGASFGQ
jgi:hypothetical protein